MPPKLLKKFTCGYLSIWNCQGAWGGTGVWSRGAQICTCLLAESIFSASRHGVHGSIHSGHREEELSPLPLLPVINYRRYRCYWRLINRRCPGIDENSAINAKLRISARIFVKIRNSPNRIFRGQGGNWFVKSLSRKSHVRLPLSIIVDLLYHKASFLQTGTWEVYTGHE